LTLYVNEFQAYWSIVLRELSVSFHEAPKYILDTTDKLKHGGTWFPGSVLNIAERCLLPRAGPAYKPFKQWLEVLKLENAPNFLWFICNIY
jgi:hypothetical protein